MRCATFVIFVEFRSFVSEIYLAWAFAIREQYEKVVNHSPLIVAENLNQLKHGADHNCSSCSAFLRRTFH